MMTHTSPRHPTPLQRAGYGWEAADNTVRPIQWVAVLTTAPAYMEWLAPSAFVGFMYAALVWVVALLALLSWSAYAFVTERKPSWPERALASAGSASATTLYIPLLYLLLACFSCGVPQVRPGVSSATFGTHQPPPALTHPQQHTRRKAPCGQRWARHATGVDTWRTPLLP